MKFYSLRAQIWEDDLEGEIMYYVAQAFDESGQDDEIIAHGVGNDWADAEKQVRQAVISVL
jgi:hypothetical protein